MRVVAVVNQKGGVGKTTTTVNLGHALALAGKRVMLVDLDPQGHLAACLGMRRPPVHGVDRVLMNGDPLVRNAVDVRDGMSLLCCGDGLSDFGDQLVGKSRAFLLQEALAGDPPDVDYLLCDCPPSSSMLAVNAVTAADDALIPVAGDYLSLSGLARLMLTLKRLEPMWRKPLRQWVFLSRYMPRRRLAREVRDRLLLHFPENLLNTPIREAAALAECAGAGKTIFEYRRGSPAAAEFAQLSDDLLYARVMSNEQENACHVA